MPHATLPSPGLQALILCGPGVSLNTFTSNPADLPKSLLPIANRPMVWYAMDWCHRMGISAITLITPPESEAPLQSALATNPALTSLPSPKAEILAPKGLLQTTGTGELLRLPEVQRAITGDFVVLPCDLISEMDGSRLLQQWLTLNSLSASDRRKGALGLFYPTHGLEGISHKKDETDFLATIPVPSAPVPSPQGSIRPCIEQVVINMPTDTLKDKLEEDKGVLRLRQSLMEKHGQVKMRLKHRDSHVYFFPRWVKEFAAANERFDSISEDVIGWWAKATWQNGLVTKLGLSDILQEKTTSMDESQDNLMDEELDISSLSTTKANQPVLPDTRSLASRVGAQAAAPRSTPALPPVLAYVQPVPSTSTPQPLIRRVDTSAQLLNISLHLAKLAPGSHSLAHEHKIHPSAQLEQQARVSESDSLIGSNVRLGFRSNVKESVVGANCDIGKYVRLTRCLIMEGAVIGDGVTLTGCIIGRRARIEGVKKTAEQATTTEGQQGAAAATQSKAAGKQKANADADDDDEKTKLTDCEVAPNFVVEAGTEAKAEKLMAFDTDDLDDFDDDEDVDGGVDDDMEDAA